MHNKFEDLLAMAPPMSPEMLLSDAAKILIALLAHQKSGTPEEWLANRMRRILVEEIIATYPDANPRPLTLPPLSVRQQDPAEQEQAARRWTNGDIENCLRKLIEPAREALKELKVLPPRPDMHRLWTGAFEPTKGYRDEAKREWDQRLARSGPYREYLRPTSTHFRALGQLRKDAPNLSAVTDCLVSHLQVARRSRLGLRSAPRLLLNGPPAAGKTWWAEQVALALGLPCEILSLANVTANFEIAGGSTQWYSAKPGRIVRAFLNAKSASPVIVLDEVDKAMTRSNYPTADSLLDLVERSSATRWHDEFYSRNFDVSTALIIATANEPEKIDAPLRSRFQVFHVKAPRPDQMIATVRSVWRNYRQLRHDLRLPAELDDAVVQHIATRSEDARAVMREFDRVIANAAERGGRIQIGMEDLRHPRPESVYLPEPEGGAPMH